MFLRKVDTQHFDKYLYIVFDVETMVISPNTKGEREDVVYLVCATLDVTSIKIIDWVLRAWFVGTLRMGVSVISVIRR